jgi:hypothetical protein
MNDRYVTGKIALALVGAVLMFPTAASAAQASTPTPLHRSTSRQALPPTGADTQPDDILVEGYRERGDIQTRVGAPTAVWAVRNRQAFEFSERLAKCAARGKLTSTKRLRAVVDGEFNTTTHAVAQDLLKRTYITCSESPTLLSFTTLPANAFERMAANTETFGDSGSNTGPSGTPTIAPLGWSIYDRGAFVIEALRLYAPDLRLTRTKTNDPAVQSRFNLREVPRNRFRLPVDYRYFQIAVCMVRLQPKLAVRLATSEGSARIGDTQAALIDRARLCVGGAKSVQVDPTQFRIYIADAVYRWAVAANNVESLIPDQAN